MSRTILFSILAATLTSVVMFSVLHLSFAEPRIATVDVVLITSQFIKEEAKKNHSNHDKEVAIKAFSHELERALQQLSQSKSLILLPKEAVIKGSSDYTANIMATLSMERQS